MRDPLNWAKYLDEAITLYGDKSDVKFQSHHWPLWGTDKIVDYLKKQRDLYKYMHDQSLNLLNKGYTGVELSNMITLPPELHKAWPNRGYYGTLKHNTRAIYQRYMGFYDANPSSLDPLPPEDAAKKYVEYMGGAAADPQTRQSRLREGRISLGRRGAAACRLRRTRQQGGEGSARRRL